MCCAGAVLVLPGVRDLRTLARIRRFLPFVRTGLTARGRHAHPQGGQTMLKTIARRRWLAVVVPLFACSYMAAVDAYAANARIATEMQQRQSACGAPLERLPGPDSCRTGGALR